MNDKIKAILQEAMMCSMFISPDDPGLTYEEACLVAKQFDYMDGEIADAARGTLDNYQGNKYIPTPHAFINYEVGWPENPRLLDYNAADLIFEALNFSVRSVGAGSAGVDKQTLIAQAADKNISELGMRAAITIYKFANAIKEEKGIIRYVYSNGTKDLPGGRLRSKHQQVFERPLRQQIYPIVQDIISRRIDGRAKQIEALDAFTDALAQIGYGHFRLWWAQIVSEFRRTDPSNPISCLALSAAISEAALTFAAKYAKDKGLNSFRSNGLGEEPKGWRMEKLLEAAAFGPNAALTGPAKTAAERLNHTRQRIHAGRVLSDNPGGLPDLKPEEARAAKDTAEQVVRAVLEWLGRQQAG